jgi:quercetin dioxygenase-like cupin family protein
MQHLSATALSLLATTAISSAADVKPAADIPTGEMAAIAWQLPADHPVGTKAAVTPVSLKRVLGVHEPMLSMFLVDYLPNGSAVLHRSSTSGYVVVHVLSGAVRAQAWNAWMGTYRAGETWIEPAFADDVTTKNASALEPARALVVLITNDAPSPELEEE